MNRSASGKARIDKAESAAFFLLAAAVLSRLLFAGRIGPEGMGYLSEGLEVYALVLTAVGQTAARATASLVRSRVGKGHLKSAHRLMKTALWMTAGVGILLGVFCIAGAGILSESFFLSPLSYLTLIAAGPGIVFLGVAGVVRGYFQGTRLTTATLQSYFLQALLYAAAGTLGGALFFSYGEKVAALLRDERYAAAYGAAGVMAGVSAASVLTLLHLTVIYFLTRRTAAKRRVENDVQYAQEKSGSLCRLFPATWLPFFLCALPGALVLLCDARIYFATANAQESAYADWGSFYGKTLPFVQGLAFLLTIPFTGLILSLAREWSRGSGQNYRNRFGIAVRLSLYLTVPAAFLLTALSGLLSPALYGGEDAVMQTTMTVAAVTLILLGTSQLFAQLLLRTGHLPALILAGVAALSGQAVVLALLRRAAGMGIEAAAIAWLVYCLLLLILQSLLGCRVVRLRLSLLGDLVRIVLCAAIAAVPVYLMAPPLQGVIGAPAALAVSLLVFYLIYLILSLFTGAADLYHIDRIPGGILLVRIARLFRLV
ncbi:MAG: hypothetical protein Q4C60_09350 [Eubacteriales bacterium]|nr:hypothetical protein [Eubacteriales bacterium]